MQPRTHKTMVYALLLCGIVIPTTARSDAPKKEIWLAHIAHSDRNTLYTWVVAPARLDATAWRDRAQDVPLSVAAAARIATNTLSSQDLAEKRLNAVTLLRPEDGGSPDWFFYMVSFADDTMAHQIEVVILLDGSIIEPRSKPMAP
jgi:hypothetical protein